MIGQKIPLFTSGNILTQEMLEAMKDYSIGFGELTYNGYSDGILRGCKVTTTQDLIILNRGILIKDEKVFFITEPISIPYRPTNEWLIFKVSFQGEVKTESFITRDIEVKLSSESELQENEIEICRFKLQQGARLRYEYQSFDDRATEFDTIHEIHAKWAAYEKSSITPIILNAYAKEAMKSRNLEAYDIAFCQQIFNSNGQSLNRDGIVFYLMTKLDKPYKAYNNEEIYEGLKDALKKIKGKRVERSVRETGNRRIIVD